MSSEEAAYAETEQPYHYIGRCRICGATLASVGDSRERRTMTADGVSRMVMADLIVERVRSEVAWCAKEDCGCSRKASKGKITP